jgi:tRNA pseudouridine55 synthase
VNAPHEVRASRTPRPAPVRDRVDGVLVLDKPKGLSSNHAMLAARRLMGAAKAGHGGTLDPMASGVLPIVFGEATKFAHDLLDADKTYLATLRLGETSTTGDAEGVLARTHVSPPDEAGLRAAIERFVGPILQRPPMHSALKHQGRPLYEYARNGVDIEREARPVVVHSIDLLSLSGDLLSVRVVCSKGTYIRTLAQDIGESAGCGAWLFDLRREAVDSLTLAQSVSLDQLEAFTLSERRATLAPLDGLLQRLRRVDLDHALALRFSQGQRLRLMPRTESAPERVRVYQADRLLGVAMLDAGVLISQRLIASLPNPVEKTQDILP